MSVGDEDGTPLAIHRRDTTARPSGFFETICNFFPRPHATRFWRFFSSHSNAKNGIAASGGGNMPRLASAVVWTSLFVAIGSVSAEPFTVDCQFPFENIKKHHPIDDNCPAHGESPAPSPAPPSPGQVKATSLQNVSKNNFCAASPAPTPALVTFISFKKLQQKLYQKAPQAKHWTRQSLPENRDVLHDIYTTSEHATIGEGSVVTFAAWLMKFKWAGGETCNCVSIYDDDHEGNDIHLVLVPSSPSVSCCWTAKQRTADCKASAVKALECKSVTAEISPHFRPDQWANEDSMCKAASQHPLRFKGQLMYDAGHRPCPRPPHSTDPARVSSWELHPVYAIDVCKNKSLSSCKADNDSVWTPLDQWHGDE